MSDRVQLSLRVPEQDVERYEQVLKEKFGQKSPYAGTELERELRAFLKHGDLHEIETELDRLIQAAGARPMDSQENKTPLARSVSGGSTRVIQYRIDPDVRSDFMTFVEENCDSSAGQMIGRILTTYAEGGISARIRRKLERVVDDTEKLLESYNPESDGRLTRRKSRIIKVCQEYNQRDGVLRADIISSIEDVGISSQSTIEGYLDDITDRLDFVEHPNKSDLFISEEAAEELQRDNTSMREKYEEMSHDDKIRKVRLVLFERAEQRGWSASLHPDDIQSDIFDHKPSDGYTYELMEEVSLLEGFNVNTIDGKKRVTVNIDEITNHDFLSYVANNSEAGRTAESINTTDKIRRSERIDNSE